MLEGLAKNAKVISAEIYRFGFVESGELRIGFDVVVRLAPEVYDQIDKNDGLLEASVAKANESIAELVKAGLFVIRTPEEQFDTEQRLKYAEQVVEFSERRKYLAFEKKGLERQITSMEVQQHEAYRLWQMYRAGRFAPELVTCPEFHSGEPDVPKKNS